MSLTKKTCKHTRWSIWKVVGYTGDWFNPRIVERRCLDCGETQSGEM